MLVQLRRRADRIVTRIPHEAVYAGLELLILTLLAVQIARFGWTAATPVDPLNNWQPLRGDAGRAPVDATLLGSFDPFFRQASDGAATEVSSLGLTLLGTRVDTVSGRGSAIIQTQDGKQSSFLVGEAIVPGVRLKAIAFDSVTLDSGGRAESLFLDQSKGSTPVTPASAGIAAAAPSALPPPRLAADILVMPQLKEGKISGYVLMPKGSGAAFAAAGLQAGDVLVTVDGAPVANVRDPASLTKRLDAGGVDIGIERGGRPTNLRIGGSK
jgi:general secretion pathway protein C